MADFPTPDDTTAIYMDDVALWSTAPNQPTLKHNLQQQLNIVQQWSLNNNLTLNPTKCHMAMHLFVIFNFQLYWI